MKKVVSLLLWIGLVTQAGNGRLRWPLKIAPLWRWKMAVTKPRAYWRCSDKFYVFRNLPGVVKWTKGRLLPRRWGFGFMELIEFGDRG